MPSLSSYMTPLLVAFSKLSSNSTSSSVPQSSSPPYLSHPLPMILPGIPQTVTPSYDAESLNNSVINTTMPTPSTSALTSKHNSALLKGNALQAKTSNSVTTAETTTQAQNAPTLTNSPPTTFEGKAAQLNTFISQYNQARNTLFETYEQYQKNATVAQYNVRQVAFSLLAASQYAKRCTSYFEQITTDNTLTQAQIDTVQKSFDTFKAQCIADSIPFNLPRPRTTFFSDQVTPPANIAEIIKVLHLLQHVLNGYAKIIYSETGFYPKEFVIDYTGNGGTTIETGTIRTDINMFQNFYQFLHMVAHELGHLYTMVYNQESTITVPVPLFSYTIPPILYEQLPIQQKEAEADIYAGVLAAIYGFSLSHPYSIFQSQPVLTLAQTAQNSHPQGVKRAEIMRVVQSQLMHIFEPNLFGKPNIWSQFARQVRSVSGINVQKDIPTMAELLRIYNLSPQDRAQQLRTLQASYPKLFTNTARGDSPPVARVTVDMDKQLDPRTPPKTIRRGAPTQTIEEFQKRWDAAGGRVPFPSTPSIQPIVPRVAAVSSTAANAVMPPPVAVSSAPPTQVYDEANANTATTLSSQEPILFADVPHGSPATQRPTPIKEQEITGYLNEEVRTDRLSPQNPTRRLRA